MAAATGSPASRKLTKLTPLTTRPSLTSRQGMTRTLNMSRRRFRLAQQSQRFGGAEPAVVERTTGDGAFEFSRARLKQCSHIVDGSKTARGDHRNGHGV